MSITVNSYFSGAGLGRILDAIAPHEPAEVVAVEVAPQLSAVLYRENRPAITLRQRDFLTLSPDDLGQFDAIAMNPPFHMRADIRHITHALKFLRPGGRLAAICMHTRHRVDALRAAAWHWEPLPETTFAETGTRVATVLLSIDAPNTVTP